MPHFTFEPDVIEMVQSKDYGQVIEHYTSSYFDDEEKSWAVENMPSIVAQDKAKLYDANHWHSHYRALQEAIAQSDIDPNPFSTTLVHYNRRIKNISTADTLVWVGEQIIECVKENRYDYIPSIAYGVAKSPYIPIKAEGVMWMGIERLMQGKVSSEPDHVQLNYLMAFLVAVSEWDYGLALSTLNLGKQQNKAQSDAVLGEVVNSNAVGHLGIIEVRYPGFSLINLPPIDTSEHERTIKSRIPEVMQNVEDRFFASYYGKLNGDNDTGE